MKVMDIERYNEIRSGRLGAFQQPRGLIAVWGKEAVQFLDGLISNNVKALADGNQMLAAFPNAQGRLLALVRVLRQGDRFLFETEAVTREKVHQNLFRFTFAGNFFVEDLSDNHRFIEVINTGLQSPPSAIRFNGRGFETIALPSQEAPAFIDSVGGNDSIEIDDSLYEALRVESGIPKYGIDMDETTIVPELGLEGLISYNKGCYIGQEIIARIHFRGHVAKQLTGIMSEPGAVATGLRSGAALTTVDGKNGGRITSTTFSPKLDRTIALAYVRYDYLAEGTELIAGGETAVVKNLPFI
jgi:tRNA-modifying protein YgfZ